VYKILSKSQRGRESSMHPYITLSPGAVHNRDDVPYCFSI
jgi:hypothetical protein